MYTSYHTYTIHHHDMDHARHRLRKTVCPHPYVRILHRRRVASNPSLGRHGATRATIAMRAMRCVRARFAPIRDASDSARRPRERRPSRDDRAAIAMTRSRCRPRDGFEATPTVGDDATTSTRRAEDAIRRFDVSRVYNARARTARRAHTETRDGGSVARARGARTRARRRGAARRRRIKRRRATRLEDERDRTGKGEE